MKIPKYMLDPDGGGTGSGDPDTDPGGEPSGDKATGAGAVDTKAIADAIRSGLSSVVESVRPAPVDPRAAARDMLEKEAAQVNERYDALCADGKFAEAQNLRDNFIRKANSLHTPSLDDDPTVSTAVEIGERLAKAEHKDIMKRWGDEVRREVMSMPANERIKPNAWDRAVDRVRTSHIDEIINERVDAGVAARRAEFVPPESGETRSRKREGAAAKLTEDQAWGQELTGVAPEEFIEHLKIEEEFDKRPMSQRGPGYGYPIMKGEPFGKDFKIEAGKF